MRYWWFSCKSFTGLVVSDENDYVTDRGMSQARAFRGRHIKELAANMRMVGDFKYKELELRKCWVC